MGNENGKASSRLDLYEQAKNHYLLIQELSFNPQLFHPNFVQLAITRYEKFWLPFAIANRGQKLVAPIDIELVWIAHMLNPLAYEQDCGRYSKFIIPHKILSPEERADTALTKNLWFQMYGNRNIPYDVDTKKNEDIFFQSKLSSNLLPAVEDYRTFCRQVSLPHYYDDTFLENAIHSYKIESLSGDFSRMAFPYHKAFIWKTHMLNPVSYLIDVEAVQKGIVDRVEYLNRHARKKGYYDGSDDNHAVAGAMFRGEVTPLRPLFDTESIPIGSSKTMRFQLMGYRLDNLESDVHYQIQLLASSELRKREVALIDISARGKGVTLFKSFAPEDKDRIFEFNTDHYDSLVFMLTEHRRRENIAFHSTIGFPNGHKYDVGGEYKIELTLKNNTYRQTKSTWFRLRALQPPNSGNIDLHFHDAELRSHSNYCKVIYHPKTMAPYAIKHDDTPCSYLNIALRNSSNNTVLNCRFLETHLRDFSSVEVFDKKNNVIASSYTVGKESLPTLSQVSHPEHCCIFRGDFETVFIIRSTNFDWGLLKVFCDPDENDLLPKKILFQNLKSMERKWEELYNSQHRTEIITYVSRDTELLIDVKGNSCTVPCDMHLFPELLGLGATIIYLFNVNKLQF